MPTDVYVQYKCGVGDPADLRLPMCKGLVPDSDHLTETTEKDISGQEERSYEVAAYVRE